MRFFKSTYSLVSMIFMGVFMSLLSACSSEKPLDKTIVGTWVQETPISITDEGIRTTITDTILQVKTNGETHLSRNLDIIGRGLPETGISVSVELRGNWELVQGRLRQTPASVLVIPRETNDVARNWADQLQEQAEQSTASVKTIVSANKTQLILQDVESGTTDVYRRK